MHGHRLSQVNDLLAAFLGKITQEQQSDLMHFTFGKKENKGFSLPAIHTDQSVNGNEKFLPDQVCDEMFLGGIYLTGLPKQTDLFKEWIKDVKHGLFETEMDDGFCHPDGDVRGPRAL